MQHPTFKSLASASWLKTKENFRFISWKVFVWSLLSFNFKLILWKIRFYLIKASISPAFYFVLTKAKVLM